MAYKNFRVICVVRVAGLAFSIFILFYLVFKTQYYATSFVAFLLIVYQIIVLIRYVEKTNKLLERFLISIKHSDFTQSFSAGSHGSSFDGLKNAFTEVMEEFKRTRSEKEEHFKYLQTVVRHVGVGLISFTEDGKVELINPPAKKLLNVSVLNNVMELEQFSKTLTDTLFTLKSGENALIKVATNNELLQLSVFATELKMRDKNYKLISLQNIHHELEEKELEAWHNLIRVLTHEIMNSMTPISSLASTISGQVETLSEQASSRQEHSEDDTFEDIQLAAQTIQRRSKSLKKFIESYRDLTLIPKPKFEILPVTDLIDHIGNIMEPELKKNNIRFEYMIEPESIELTADPDLIGQVMINLIKNAIESLSGREDTVIRIESLLSDKGKVILKVIDNGPGIQDDIEDKIFIPFYSTKKTGSGIGLSLSRQIMRLHKGTISVKSIPGAETVFMLRF